MKSLLLLTTSLFISFLTPLVVLPTDLTDTLKMKLYIEKASYYQTVNPDSVLYFAKEAFLLAEKNKSKPYISLASQQLGYYYIEKESFELATKYFLSALTIEENLNNKTRIAELNNNLGYIYQILEQFQKSMNYYNIALTIYTNIKDTSGLASTYINIGNLHNSREYCETRTIDQRRVSYNTAISYYRKSVFLYSKTHNELGINRAYANIGNVYGRLNQPKIALSYLSNVLVYYRKNNNIDRLLTTLRSMGKSYTTLRQYSKATNCYNESAELAEKHNLKSGIQFLYEDMAYNFEMAGDYKKSKIYYVKYMILRDSIYSSVKSKQIFELETNYQTVKKEKEIISLMLTQKKKNIYIGTLLALLTVLGLSAAYSIRIFRNKRLIAEQTIKINEQKIKELKNEQQLQAIQSVFQGEEAERTRLARDLHDGLGGLLSGVKLTLSGLKGNYIVAKENADKFDHALNLLDSSIKEMRRISHNMMPDALIKFGLKDALQDFIIQIEKTKKLKTNFMFYGEAQRIDSATETSLYRIACEIVNNALKHAEASELLVQLIQDNTRIHLTVQDNGKGFDITKIDTLCSSGLRNIQSRIDALNGKLEIITSPGNGTEVSVEITIQS